MAFTLGDTFHLSEQEDDECSLNVSFVNELDMPSDNCEQQNIAAAKERTSKPGELRGNGAVDCVECKQQQNFPFIPGTEPSKELRSMLSKCRVYSHFYEMPNILERLEHRTDRHHRAWTPCWRPILRTVAVAGLNTLLIGNGAKWSTVSLGSVLASEGKRTPVKYVVVHHELRPTLRRYLAMLQEDGVLTVLTFPQLQVVSRFSAVASVRSVDEHMAGLPALLIAKLSGEQVRWSYLYSDAIEEDTQSPPPAAMLQVAEILRSKLHTACERLLQVEASCRQREAFISRHVTVLRDVVSGADPGAAPAQLLHSTLTRLPSVTAGDELCRIASVRCKLLHSNVLLVCVALVNTSTRLLLSDLELVLNLQSEHEEDRSSPERITHPHLEYCSYVYKSVMRVSSQEGAEKPSTVSAGDKSEHGGADDPCKLFAKELENSSDYITIKARGCSAPRVRVLADAVGGQSQTCIELLSPPLLRPKKQAYIIGICQMPVFSSGRHLRITGLVRLKTRPLSLQDGKFRMLVPSHREKMPGNDTSTKFAQVDASNESHGHVEMDDSTSVKGENISPQFTSSKPTNPPSLRKKGIVNPVDFMHRNEAVFVNLRYPKYNDDSSGYLYQMPIKTISIDAVDLDAIRISLTSPPPITGVSLGSLALIAGSEKCRVLLHSAVSNLSVEQLLAQLAQYCIVMQVTDLCNVHVLCPTDPSASLHRCALSLTQQHERSVAADLYFRDLRQGLALVHTLKAVLPLDAAITPIAVGKRARVLSEATSTEEAAELRVRNLLSRMQEIAKFLCKGIHNKFVNSVDTYEQEVKKAKLTSDTKPVAETKSAAESYKERRKLFLASGGSFTVDRDVYEAWKSQLKILVESLDKAYLEAHPLECDMPLLL